MTWDRKLWGVEVTTRADRKPFLIGTAWNGNSGAHYAGEPSRALMFTTRAEARTWCFNKKADLSNSDLCRHWKLRPERVRETVRAIR